MEQNKRRKIVEIRKVLFQCCHQMQKKKKKKHSILHFNGWGMGPPLVLVSPCFRENVVVTCKIESFLCSLAEKCDCFLFWKSYFKMKLTWKQGYFWPTFHIFLVTREKLKSFSTYRTHILHVFCSPYWLFLPYQFWKKKKKIYQVWFLFGVIPGVDSYSRHFGTINK